MRLSNFSDYGIRVLMYTAGIDRSKLCTTKEVSDYYGISYNHLVKVVHKLSSLGYLKIKKGRSGGFELNRDPKKVRLGEIVKDLEPDFFIVECFDSNNQNCKVLSFCKAKSPLFKAQKAFLRELNRTSLYDLTKNTSKEWGI